MGTCKVTNVQTRHHQILLVAILLFHAFNILASNEGKSCRPLLNFMVFGNWTLSRALFSMLFGGKCFARTAGRTHLWRRSFPLRMLTGMQDWVMLRSHCSSFFLQSQSSPEKEVFVEKAGRQLSCNRVSISQSCFSAVNHRPFQHTPYIASVRTVFQVEKLCSPRNCGRRCCCCRGLLDLLLTT